MKRVCFWAQQYSHQAALPNSLPSKTHSWNYLISHMCAPVRMRPLQRDHPGPSHSGKPWMDTNPSLNHYRLGVFFKMGFKRSPLTVGGFWYGPPPFIKWGGFGSTSPFIEWGGFRALSLRGKTPPLNEGGAFQNAPPSTVAITIIVTRDHSGSFFLRTKKKFQCAHRAHAGNCSRSMRCLGAAA